MPVSEICNREVVIVQPGNTTLEAARLMRQHHVGDVLVVEDRSGVRVPVGIVTDRDLRDAFPSVFEEIAAELDKRDGWPSKEEDEATGGMTVRAGRRWPAGTPYERRRSAPGGHPRARRRRTPR